MNSNKGKFAPQNYKGNIAEIPLWTIIDYISFTCILFIKNGTNKSTGALYYKKGELIGARYDNDYDINKANEILKWKTGTFSYQKWNNEFVIDIEQIKDVFYFIEITDLNVVLNLPQKNEMLDIHYSEGKIVSINPVSENIKLVFTNILKRKTGKINIKLTTEQTGNLDLYYSELFDIGIQLKKPVVSEDKNKSASSLNISIIKKTFQNIKNNTENSFVAGLVYSSSDGKHIHSYKKGGKHEILFTELYKSLDNRLNNTHLNKGRNYYLINLQDNFLIFIMIFKDYHIGFVFNDIKTGYLLNIIRPIIINDYTKAINND